MWNPEKVIGCKPDAFCDALVRERPKWITGSLSQSDTRFLFKTTLTADARVAVEIGTASGFSTAVLCHALNFASQVGAIGSDFNVISYDISPYFYADKNKRVGDAAREQLPAELLEHIIFRHPAVASDLKRYHSDNEVGLLFIDANHNHPWPTLDLLATLDSLRPGAVVLLHDINLPVIHPQFASWGVKYLFDELEVEKEVPRDCEIPNMGSIKIPEDKEGLHSKLREILFAHEWQVKVDEGYLTRMGISR